jgi:hypothetical protein
LNLISPIIDFVAARLGYMPMDADGRSAGRTGAASANSVDLRREGYRQRELFYRNGIYLPQKLGGLQELILKYDLNRGTADPRKLSLLGYFNPVEQIVDAYGGLFPGTWGDGTTIKDNVDGTPVNPKLAASDALGKIWKWSGLDTEKQKLLKWGPNLGTVGLRISGRDDPDPLKRRAYIQVDHPGRIVDFNEDDRGNCTEVLLEYQIPAPGRDLDDRASLMVTVREELTRERFSQKFDGDEQLTSEQQENKLGVCPYVILRHNDTGNPFGDWAYVGSEPIIHAINYQFALLAKSTGKTVFPKWFGTGGGDPPTNFDTGEDSVAYVKTFPDTPPPSLQALVATVDYAGILSVVERLTKNLRERQPEMNFGNIDVTPSLSGEALQQFMKPTEKRILDARPNYDHAIKRAEQIAMSVMILLDILNLGTGSGTKEAADRAYHSGAMDFDFADRPALPLTMFQKLQQHQLEQAPMQAKLATARQAQGIVSNKEQLLMIGKTKAEADAIMADKAAQVTSEGL